VDQLSVVKEDHHGELNLRLPIWSDAEIQALGSFLQASDGSAGSKDAQGRPIPRMPDHVANLLTRVHEAQLERNRDRTRNSDAESAGTASDSVGGQNVDESLSVLTAAALAHGAIYAQPGQPGQQCQPPVIQQQQQQQQMQMPLQQQQQQLAQPLPPMMHQLPTTNIPVAGAIQPQPPPKLFL